MVKYKLYGAILGDLAGQPYEFPIMQHFPFQKDINLHNPESHITDDTIMTLATAYAILNDVSYSFAYKLFGNNYTGDYYGKNFKKWLSDPTGTIGNSYGNGCLMRMSPIMYMKKGVQRYQVIESCICSHSHPNSIIACESLIELYRRDCTYWIEPLHPTLKKFERFAVDADSTINFIYDLFRAYQNDTRSAIRKAVSLGGDTDTNASIIGELVNFHKNDITKKDAEYVESKLDNFQLSILKEFNKKFKHV